MVELVSDGCTAFWFVELIFPIRRCCVFHDEGGSDDILMWCILENTPPIVWPFVPICILLMMFGRPIYHRFKPQVTAFYERWIRPNLRR